MTVLVNSVYSCVWEKLSDILGKNGCSVCNSQLHVWHVEYKLPQPGLVQVRARIFIHPKVSGDVAEIQSG